MSPSAPSSTTVVRVHSIVTVTESPGTTTIFITTILPITTPALPSSTVVGGGSGPSKQKAVIAGSAVGGFVGFSLILGLLLWFFYFRGAKGKESSGDDQPATYLAGRKAHEEKSVATPSLSTSEPHTSAPTSHPDGRDKVAHGRDQEPVQFPSSAHPPEAAASASATHPVRRRTITSDSENGTHRIPVVVPSFAYRESTASASSGSRIVNVLKRTSAAGGTVSSSSSRRRMSDVPYQYGVVGSADSRLGGLLGLEPGSSRLGPVHHDATGLEGRRAEALYGPASSPNRVSVPLSVSHRSRAHEHSPMHKPHLSVSTASGGGPISGSGSISGHSADSPILATAAGSSYHEPDQPLHAIPAVGPSTPLSYSGRPQRPSSPLDEHIILSNYISPPSAVSSSSSLSTPGGKKSSWKVRGKRRSATVSDSGQGAREPSVSPNAGTSSAPDHATWNMQRSLSLDMAFIRNTTSRTKRDDVSPRPPLSAGPSQSTPTRQASPPSSFPHAQLSSFPSGADALAASSSVTHPPVAPIPVADTPNENDSEYSSSASAEERRRRRRRRRSRSRRRRTFSGDITPNEMINPQDPSFVASRRAPESYGHAFGHSQSPHSHEYSMLGSAEYEHQDEELVRLARIARRAERKIRRESRRQSDPGHGDGLQQRDPSQPPQHRSRPRKSRQRAGSRTRIYPGSADDAPSSQRPRLVLRNV